MCDGTCNIVDKVVADTSELGKELAVIVEQAAEEAIRERGIFTIGLSGGSLPKLVCAGFPSIKSDWSAWRLLLCDERLVPLSSPDSTLQLYLQGLLACTPLEQHQFIAVNTDLDASAAADCYESALRSLQPDCVKPDMPVFDVLLLGVGPDGHTASLFPGHPLLDESSLLVAPITDSPKPPPCRVTLTLPAINSARRCVFALAGAEKAGIVEKLFEQRTAPITDGVLPAARVRPANGEVVWLLDAAAAAQL